MHKPTMLTCSNDGTTTPWGHFGTISSLTTSIFSKSLQPLHQADWGCGSKNLMCLDICNMLYMKHHYSNFSICTNPPCSPVQMTVELPLGGHLRTISSLTTPIFSKSLQPLHQVDWGCGSKNLLCLDICNMLYMKRHYSNFSLCTNYHAHLFPWRYNYPLRAFWKHLIPHHSHIFKKVPAIASGGLSLWLKKPAVFRHM